MTTSDGRLYVLDVGVLIALTNADHVHHGRAHTWFTTASAWATTPLTESAFVRLMLNPVVTGRQHRAAEILAALGALRSSPGHHFVTDDSTLADPRVDLSGMLGHRQVTDFHLINLAAHHDAILATLDSKLSGALVGEDRRWVELV